MRAPRTARCCLFPAYGPLMVGLVTLAAAGCVDEAPGWHEPEPCCDDLVHAWPQSLDRDVDLLFVIDNSISMLEEQETLRTQFPALMRGLRDLPGGLPNMHIGVTSTDLGVGPYTMELCDVIGGDGGRLLTSGCPSLAAGGAQYIVDVEPKGCELEKSADGHCVSHDCTPAHCAHEPGTSFFVEPGPNDDPAGTGCPRCRNYDGTPLEDVFSCMASLGVDGCYFEHSLEAMRLALDPATPGSADFVRENSTLTIILLTDEDDCSAATGELFDPSATALDSPLGPLTSYRCFEFGVTCHVNGRSDTTPLREHCVPREPGDPDLMLHGLDRYIDFLNELKDPEMMIVSAIAGPLMGDFATGSEVGVYHDPAGTPYLRFTCQGEHGRANPGIRLKHVVKAFNSEEDLDWAYTSICLEDFSPALEGIADRIKAALGGQCFGGPLLGCTDPGARLGQPVDAFDCNDTCQAECLVEDIHWRGTDDESRQDVPPCLEICPDGPCPGNEDPAAAYASGRPEARDPGLPVVACWQVVLDPACEASRSAGFLISRQADPPPRSFAEIVCGQAPAHETSCEDGRDNDFDCLTDAQDPDCAPLNP